MRRKTDSELLMEVYSDMFDENNSHRVFFKTFREIAKNLSLEELKAAVEVIKQSPLAINALIKEAYEYKTAANKIDSLIDKHP